MTTRYSAMDIAVYVINSSIDAGYPVSNLQLQKILYFIQVEYYRRKGTPLFGDDFRAWQYGPVVPEIYRLFSIWGGSKISTKITAETNTVSAEVAEIIDPVISEYRQKNPWDLVEEAHKKDSPWDETMVKCGNDAIIPKELIREYVK